MSFTSIFFLLYFLPFTVFTIYALRIVNTQKGKTSQGRHINCISKIFLTIISFVFYGWSCFDNIFRFFLYIVIVYIVAHLMSICKNKQTSCSIKFNWLDNEQANREKTLNIFNFKNVILLLATLFFFGILTYFKYWDFIITNLNHILSRQIERKTLLAPLGLSFITFSTISYLVDIYRGDALPGSFLDCGLFLTFFPKVVSGPIVLWKDFQTQLASLRSSVDEIVYGLNRIITGLAKKLILADMFGSYVAEIHGAVAYGIDRSTAWLATFLFTLQIYYDFAGYSDIAIGLASIFGFKFRENFHFPYCSRSISEFWRRWHISLGTWFREYLYIPLGGSRLGIRRTVINLAAVFLATGLWHGAGWVFILWGGINGLFAIIERLIQDRPGYKWYSRSPLSWLITMFTVMMCWELFRSTSLNEFANWCKLLFGANAKDVNFSWQYYLDFRLVFLVIIGILGATALNNQTIFGLYRRCVNTTLGMFVQEMALLALFVLSIICMVNSTYSPFLYFQF